MRVAAILGPGASPRDVQPFKQVSDIIWLEELPANPREADATLIFGGDGTIHRYLPRLVEARRPVLVVPCGSGNDFARALGLRNGRDSLTAWREFVAHKGSLRAVDLGLITPIGAGEPHYFCSAGGVGLDAEIARRANRLPRWLRAHGGYALALIPALFEFAPLPMKILTSGEQETWITQSAAPATLIAFANSPSYGGGMKIAPRARLDDGQLEVCIVTEIDRLKLFCLFPTVYFGRHLRVNEVRYFQTERLRLETETPLEVYADGEFVCHTPIEVSVAKGALQVITSSKRLF